MRWIPIPLVVAALLVIGCDGDGSESLALSVGASAQFQAEDGPPRAVGYQLAVVIQQVQTLPSELPVGAVDGAAAGARMLRCSRRSIR